jgi:hypothetical protein
LVEIFRSYCSRGTIRLDSNGAARGVEGLCVFAQIARRAADIKQHTWRMGHQVEQFGAQVRLIRRDKCAFNVKTGLPDIL